MSAPNKIASLARAAAVDVAWRQWAMLGAPVSSKPVGAVVDPEALLLLSCALRDAERRLDDILAWWAHAGAALLTVQRVRSVAATFPKAAQVGLTAFARAAVNCGDARWKPLATRPDGDMLLSRGKRGRVPVLTAYPLLMLRLRAAFNVGVKADVLAVLISMGGDAATVRELVHATGYTTAAVRRAVQEMLTARVVYSTSVRPATFFVDLAAWEALLGSERGESAGWKYFAGVFAFLAAVACWGDEAADNEYLASSAARDIFKAHRYAFELNRIPFTEPGDAPGARYLDVFGTTVQSLTDWLAKNV